MRKLLLLLSFVEGSTVMAAELCGARLMAPIFGSSLYVWASVMAITLGALALGYFIGGLLSERANPFLLLHRILFTAALFVLAMPVMAYYLLPRLSYLPFLPAIVISAGVLLLPAVLLLGASSPLFIGLQTGAANSGKVSGLVYAVSTAGGICATFLCGFWLIPQAGLNATLVVFALLLAAIALLSQRRLSVIGVTGFVLVGYLNWQLHAARATSEHSDSLFGHLEVLDLKRNGRPVRFLTINNIVQTEMDLETHHSVSAYIELLNKLVPLAQAPANALVLGLGGGLAANLFIEKNYRCTGVELDPRILNVARERFFLNPAVITREDDARHYLNTCSERFDVVLVDVFRSEEQPSHVLTSESLVRLRSQLSRSGRLLINWHGYLQGTPGLGTVVLCNTLRAAGYTVQIHPTPGSEAFRNLVIAATPAPPPAPDHNRSVGSGRLNTDDRPLLETMNAPANMLWRINYLNYYQEQAINP